MFARNCAALVVLALAASLAQAAKPRYEYRVTQVAPLYSDGNAINRNGATVATYQFTGAGVHAFLTYPGGTAIIGGLGDFNNVSYGLGINDRLQVVGQSETAAGARGFIYQNGALSDINVFLPAHTSANGINNAGHITGTYQYTGAPLRGFLRAPDGGFRDIGTLAFANPYTWPLAINKHRQVVGNAGSWDGARTPHPFLYHNGSMRQLGSLGAGPGEARDINDRGQVTGYSALKAPGVRHAVVWQAGRTVDIDGRKGVGQSVGNGINNHGHVVGTSDHLGAFIWRGKKMESLDALIDPAGGYSIRDVRGINDKGQIVGYADQFGVAFGFAVRLDPVPVPCPTTASGEAAPAQ